MDSVTDKEKAIEYMKEVLWNY